MIFKQFEVKGLSHFSYAVGSDNTKEIAIIDPKRDIDTYLNYSQENNYKIKYILETHIHADYASGARELAKETGAELLVSGYDKHEQFEVQFEHEDVFDGDEYQLGEIKLKAVHTPGHTPEHMSYLIFDMNKNTDEPLYFLTGDFLFIGSVGRPDLLGEGETRELAKKLYQSVQKIKNYPDHLEVYPGHGAGSLCGAGMSKASHSTLGAEKMSNLYFKEMTEDEFINTLLSNTPPFPEYYKRMKRVNSEGPAILSELPQPKALSADEFEKVTRDASIIDTRHPLAFGGGYIPRAININGENMISSWAPWVVPYDAPVYLVTEGEEELENIVRRLIQVGLDNVKGYLNGGMDAWVAAGKKISTIEQCDVKGLKQKLESNNITVLDVRSDSEWNSGHIKGAKHIFLGKVPEHVRELLKDEPVYTICGGGFRSSIAASVLKNNGFKNVHNVFGGMGAWKKDELPVVQ